MEITLANLRRAFREDGYITDEEVLLTVYLALKLQKPLLIEGEPGVGKRVGQSAGPYFPDHLNSSAVL